MAEKVASKAGATHTLCYVAVRGRGDITDMLRYDNCAPADEGQSMKLTRLREPGAEEEWVVLKRFVPAGMPMRPTEDRWKSFGWEFANMNGSTWWPHQQQAEDAAHSFEARRVREAAQRLGAPP